ncbi:MAG: response regulator transcription factor [Lachnospiraceae bacterium]
MDETILMIEDNPDILRINRAELEDEGYRVFEATTLEQGNKLAREIKPDLILLDILLPDGNGIEYCREHLYKNHASILFLSALNTKEDVINGLRSGGDDYIAKPYLMEEMLARIEALLRRRKLLVSPWQNDIFGALKLNSISSRAYYREHDLLLTPMEYKLLELLLKNQDQYIMAKELYQKLWDMEAIDSRPVKQLVRRLREKLNDTGVTIEAEQGKGYKIVGNNRGAEI